MELGYFFPLDRVNLVKKKKKKSIDTGVEMASWYTLTKGVKRGSMKTLQQTTNI